MYSALYKRYLLPAELLNAQAIFRADAENVESYDKMLEKKPFAQSLAGNSFTGTVVQAVTITSFVCCKVWRDQTACTSPEAASLQQKAGQQCLPHPSTQSLSAAMAKDSATNEPRLVEYQGSVLHRCRGKQAWLRKVRKELVQKRRGRGNHKAKGKKTMTSIYQKEQIFQAYEKAKGAGDEQALKQVKSMHGYFKGCMCKTKWGSIRVAQSWTLLCKTAPALCKRHKELPNALRKILQLGSLKHNHVASGNGEQVHLPPPLEICIEDMLMDRIVRGEEMTMTFASQTICFAVELWNECISTMEQLLRDNVWNMLKQQDSHLADLSETELNGRFATVLKAAQQMMRPVHLKDTDAALLWLGAGLLHF